VITNLPSAVRARLTPAVPDQSFWRPGTRVPPPPAYNAPGPAGIERKIYLALAIAAGATFLVSVAVPAIGTFLDIIQGDGTRRTASSTREQIDHAVDDAVLRNFAFMLLALSVLALLWHATDDRTVGAARPVRGHHHRIALGFYLRTVCVSMILGNAVFLVAWKSWPELGTYVGTGGLLPPLPWLNVQRAVAAGWCEEIVATMLIWWILDRIPARRGRTVAHTWVGTAAIIAVHLSYHLSMGIKAVVLVLPVYFTVVCWKHARSLPALITGHVVFDLAMPLVPESTSVRAAVTWMLVCAALFLLAGAALDHRWLTGEAPVQPGAPNPPVLNPVPANLRGVFWPRTDVQPAVQMPGRGRLREVAICAVMIAAVIRFLPAAQTSAVNIMRWFTDEPMLRTTAGSDTRLALELLGAGIVVAVLAWVAGRAAVGMQRRGPGEFALAGGYALRGAFLAHILTTTVATLLIVALTSQSGRPAAGSLSDWESMVLLLVSLSITEEIFLTVLPYLLLEQVRTRSGRPVAHTWIGTCLILGLWLFLHASHGPLMVWVLLPAFYFKLILWRHTKNLPVLIGLHIGWNLQLYFGSALVHNALLLILLQFCLVGTGVLWELHGARRADDAANQLAAG